MDKFLKIAIVLSAVDKASGVISNAVSKSSKEMEKLGRTQRLAEGFDRIGNGALVAGAAVTGFFAATVAAAADIEKMQVALTTAFQGNQEAASEAFKTIQEFAARTPFQMEEVMSSFVKLKNMGLDPSMAALESYGNTASAMGKSLNDMVEAVADAATGEFERLKEFGIKAKSEGDRVTFTFRGVQTTVGKNASEIERYLLRIGATEFAGGIEAQSKTINGQMSTLQDNFKMASAAIGKALIPMLTKLFQKVTPVIEKFAVWAENNPGLFKGIAIGGVALLALGSALKVAAAAMAVFNGVAWANPITWIIAAIVALIAAIAALVIYWDEITAWMKANTPEWLKDWIHTQIEALVFLIDVLSWAWDGISNFFAGFSDAQSALYSAIGDAFSSAWQAIKDTWNSMWAYLEGLWDSFYDAGANIINSIVEGIKSGITSAVDAISGVVKKVREYLPFSPAKAGPLRDIHRVKIVETIADSIKPTALTSKMNSVMGAARATLNANISATPVTPMALASSGAGGGTSLVYSPTINMSGGTPEQETSIRQLLEQQRDEIMRILRAEDARRARTSFS